MGVTALLKWQWLLINSDGCNLICLMLCFTRWKAGLKKLPDGLLSGPIILFDKMDNAMIISPFSHFMAASFWHDNNTDSINWGIMGDVDNLPQGFRYETIVVYSDQGINKVSIVSRTFKLSVSLYIFTLASNTCNTCTSSLYLVFQYKISLANMH